MIHTVLNIPIYGSSIKVRFWNIFNRRLNAAGHWQRVGRPEEFQVVIHQVSTKEDLPSPATPPRFPPISHPKYYPWGNYSSIYTTPSETNPGCKREGVDVGWGAKNASHRWVWMWGEGIVLSKVEILKLWVLQIQDWWNIW